MDDPPNKIVGVETGALSTLGLVSEIGRQPAFDLGTRQALAAGIVFNLVARHQIDRKVTSLGMTEVQAAY